jgi:hypothetical protein
MILDLHDLFPPEKVNEAAAVIDVFLQELALQFESAYLGEIKRWRDQQPRRVDPLQPWLFEPPDDH